jgi:hypothetical protein
MATETKTACEMRCPECGAMTAFIVNTGDLTAVECGECGETIDPADAVAELKDQAARWERFAAWLAQAGGI